MISTYQKSCIPIYPISDRLKSLFFISSSFLLYVGPKASHTFRNSKAVGNIIRWCVSNFSGKVVGVLCAG